MLIGPGIEYREKLNCATSSMAVISKHPLIGCGATGAADKRGRHETLGTLETLEIARHTQPSNSTLLRWHADRKQIEIGRRAARRGYLARFLFPSISWVPRSGLFTTGEWRIARRLKGATPHCQVNWTTSPRSFHSVIQPPRNQLYTQASKITSMVEQTINYISAIAYSSL